MAADSTPSFENQYLRGFSLRNLLTTIASTAAIMWTIGTSVNEFKDAIRDIKADQKVLELKINAVEKRLDIIQKQIDEMKDNKKE